MKRFLYSARYLFLTLLIVSTIIIYLFYVALKPTTTKELPVFNPFEVSEKLVDSSIQHIKKNHRILDFNLINQQGDDISLDIAKGKIQVVDFFFTSCPGICPVLTKNMGVVQEKVKTNDKVVLFSFTVTPKKDSVPVLQAYAKKYGVIPEKWHLITGDRQQIYNLARKSYLVAEYHTEEAEEEMSLIHTENFVLVDTSGRIRGYYDGTDTQAVEKLIEDIKILEKEIF